MLGSITLAGYDHILRRLYTAMAVVYANVNQKGGVGKSTLSFDIAAAEAEDSTKNVLLIDLDPQGHSTEGIGLKDFWVRKDIPTLYDGLMSLNRINPQELIQEVPGENFFAIPSNFQMMELDKDLNSARSRETRLLDLINVLKTAFDVIIIDSPSYFGNLTDNLIRCVGIMADANGHLILDRDENNKITQDEYDLLRSGLVIPIQAEQTSVRASELLFNQIDVVQVELKIKVNQLAIVPNLVQSSSLGQRILNDFRTSLPDKLTPFDLPKKVVFQEAYELGRSIFTYEPKESKKRSDVAEMRQLYRDLITLLHERGEEYATKHS